MQRKILVFNPRIEDVPESIMDTFGSPEGADSKSSYIRIVKMFLKRLQRMKGLDAVVINEQIWLGRFGYFAIDQLEMVCANLNLYCGIEKEIGKYTGFYYQVSSEKGTVTSKIDFKEFEKTL